MLASWKRPKGRKTYRNSMNVPHAGPGFYRKHGQAYVVTKATLTKKRSNCRLPYFRKYRFDRRILREMEFDFMTGPYLVRSHDCRRVIYDSRKLYFGFYADYRRLLSLQLHMVNSLMRCEYIRRGNYSSIAKLLASKWLINRLDRLRTSGLYRAHTLLRGLVRPNGSKSSIEQSTVDRSNDP